MENLTVENKIEALKKKVNELYTELETDIYTICENLDYHNSSRFSYNIDRLHQFKTELQDFNIFKKL